MSDMYRPDIFVLDNGLQVIAVERPFGKIFAASLIYRVGNFDDPADLPGAAHFAEHLAFAGPAKKLAAQLSSLGTRINGSTSDDYREFEAVGHVTDLQLGLEFLAEIVRNPVVTTEVIENERNVFAHEIDGEEDESTRQVKLNEFRDHAVGNPNWRQCQTKGSVKVKCFTPERLNSFKQQYYHPSNARLAIVSSIPSDELRRHCLRCIPNDSLCAPSPRYEPNRNPPNARKLTICWDLSPYVWVNVLQFVAETTSNTRLAANMIAHLLGGGFHSELFRRLRTERALAYDAYAAHWDYLHCTALHCFVSVPTRAVRESLSFITDRLDEIAINGLTESELEAERARMIRWHDLAMESPARLALYLAYEGLRPPSVARTHVDYIQSLQSLTLADVHRVASELLCRQSRSIFIGGFVGPLSLFRIKRHVRK